MRCARVVARVWVTVHCVMPRLVLNLFTPPTFVFLSKIAEDFVVCDFGKPAAMQVLDPNQYCAVPKSFTTITLLRMLRDWTFGAYGNGSTVRSILFDYRKEFDLIDHRILINKLCNLELPTSIIKDH